MTTGAAVAVALVVQAVFVIGAYELGLKLGWLSRDKRAREELEAVKAEFQERRGARIDTRA
jgi:hypothetical protein